jgi:hypothetical protein
MGPRPRRRRRGAIGRIAVAGDRRASGNQQLDDAPRPKAHLIPRARDVGIEVPDGRVLASCERAVTRSSSSADRVVRGCAGSPSSRSDDVERADGTGRWRFPQFVLVHGDRRRWAASAIASDAWSWGNRIPDGAGASCPARVVRSRSEASARGSDDGRGARAVGPGSFRDRWLGLAQFVSRRYSRRVPMATLIRA